MGARRQRSRRPWYAPVVGLILILWACSGEAAVVTVSEAVAPPTTTSTTAPLITTTTTTTQPGPTTTRCMAACRAAARTCDPSECFLYDGRETIELTPVAEGPYPAWHLFFDYDDFDEGHLEARIEPGENTNKFGGLCDPHRCVLDLDFPTLFLDCDLPDCGYQVDLAVQDTGYSGTFSAFLDLHGFGTTASWSAQMGYTWSADDGLQAACTAASSSSDAPRWWQESGLSFGFDEWHTFSIRTVETGAEWGYAFEGYIDDDLVCSYQPPEGWDTDNCGLGGCFPLFEPFDAIHRAVQIRPEDGTNAAPEPIVVLIDNFYAEFTPTD